MNDVLGNLFYKGVIRNMETYVIFKDLAIILISEIGRAHV